MSEISVTDAAKRLGVGRVALSRLLNGATGISPEMALRLSKALGTPPEFWYGMQVNYDLWQAKKKFRGKVRPIVQRNPLRPDVTKQPLSPTRLSPASASL